MQKISFLSIFVFSSLGLFGTKAEAFSVRQYLDAVVNMHPNVLAASADLKAAGVDVRGAYMQLFPELQVLSNRPINQGGSESTQPQWTFALEQKLWAGGKVSAGIDIAEGSKAVAQSALMEAKLNAALEAVEALQSFRMAKERVRVGRAVMQRLSRFEALMARRVEVEMSAPIDAVLVSSRVLQAKLDQANAQAALRVAVSRLEQLDFSNQAVDWNAIDVQDLGGAIQIQLPMAPHELETLIEEKLSTHPALQRAMNEVVVARARESLASAERYPLVYLRLEQSRYDNPNFASQDGKTNAFVGLRYTPGAGLVSLAQAQASSERVQGVVHRYESVKQEITTRFREDWESWKNVTERIRGQKEVEGNSNQISDSYERQFVVGRISWQQTLDSVREYAQASLGLAEIESALWGVSYRLHLKLANSEMVAP